MWTAPCRQEAECGFSSKRLRPYVRSVDAVAHDRCQDGVHKHEFQTWSRCFAPMGPAECLVTVIDRSVPSSVLEQASACGVRPPPHAEVHDLRVGCKVMWFTLSVGEAQMHRFTDGG